MIDRGIKTNPSLRSIPSSAGDKTWVSSYGLSPSLPVTPFAVAMSNVGENPWVLI